MQKANWASHLLWSFLYDWKKTWFSSEEDKRPDHHQYKTQVSTENLVETLASWQRLHQVENKGSDIMANIMANPSTAP
jgi:hypothetical protein